MKIESDVATRLAALKKKYRRPSYSDLLDSFCAFFEMTELSPSDINTSKKPTSLLVQERTNTILSFIKQNEKLYDKKMLDLVEKIYLIVKDNELSLGPENSQLDNQKTISVPKQSTDKTAEESIEISNKLRKEKDLLESKNSQLQYKMQHQRKIIEEFFSKFDINRMRKIATMNMNDFEYYKTEISKIWS